MSGDAESGAGAVCPQPASAHASAHAPAHAAAAAPHIAQLNVSNKSRMHIGPKFVSVTQNVHNVEVIKGACGGLRLEERAAPARRLRCGVAVFACWALVVAAALAAWLLRAALAGTELLDLDIAEEWYLRRGDWQAMPAYEVNYLRTPVRHALVGHSATPQCEGRYRCIAEVLEIQRDHQRRGWADVGPNFLLSGEGLVFEGRGANAVGAMVRGWNSRSVSIMFLGDYRRDAPTEAQLAHMALLLEALVAARALTADYRLLGHCQVKPLVYTPGRLLLRELRRFPHWTDVNVTQCLD